MNLPTIEELKQQINIDHDDDNNLLLTYSSAAKTAIENYINRKLFEDSVPDDCSNGMVINDAIKVAMLLLDWYENREAINIGNITSEIPITTTMLLQPYIIYGV